MEDDEEYSYRSYSADDEGALSAAGYIGDDEEFSYSGYGDAQIARPPEAKSSSYGDFIVEEFSPESTIKKVAGVTRLSKDTVSYIIAALYFAVGVVCVVFTAYIQTAFAYIVGGFMILGGVIRFISAVRRREYAVTHTNSTASSLIFLALGIMIVSESEWAMSFIAVGWGIFGLMEGAHAFNHAFSRIARSQNPVYYLVKGSVEVVLAFMLLYEPNEHITLHIMIFGIQLMFDAVTMLPVVKKFVHNKK